VSGVVKALDTTVIITQFPTKEGGKMRLAKALTIILMFFFIAGASCQQTLKTPDQMSPKERATFALTLYNNAFANYNAQFVVTPKPMSDEIKNYFQAYKKVMEAAWPIVSTYSALVNVGGTPTPEQEQQILKLIYQLQSMLMGGTLS
jgi:hypothetical protein